MATNIFTCDPMLNFLEIKDLYKLRSLSKETKEVVDDHLQTKRVFRADLSKYNPIAEKTYQLLPSISNLTMVLPIVFSDVKMFLRPSIRSLTLELGATFHNDYDGFHLEHYFIDRFKTTLRDIKDILESGTLELEEFHITLSDTVTIYEEYETSYVSDYDEDGPIYDTDSVEIKTNSFDPIHYWVYSNSWENEEADVQEITQLLLGLLAVNKRKFKRITYPYDLFAAAKICEVFPQTITTNWRTESYNTIYEYIHNELDKEYSKDNCPCCRRRL